MTQGEIAALSISAVSALFSGFAWREAKKSADVNAPYLVGHREPGERPHLKGANADQWEISSIRLLWPLRAQFMRQEGHGIGDDGMFQPGRMVPVGRALKGEQDRIIVAGQPPSSLLLFSLALKSSSRRRRLHIIRQKKKP